MSMKKNELPSMNIKGENVVGTVSIAGGSTVNITQSSVHNTENADFEKLFELLEEKIKARPEDANVDKEEIQTQVSQIKTEAAKGEVANQNKLERWIQNLYKMAPDIFEVMVASLGGPVPGLAAVLQKIAMRVKAQLESGG